MSYSLFVASSADRQLAKLTREVQDRMDPAIDALADDPRPHGFRKMQGTKNSYRIRIGDYRVIYAVDDEARRVDVLKVAAVWLVPVGAMPSEKIAGGPGRPPRWSKRKK